MLIKCIFEVLRTLWMSKNINADRLPTLIKMYLLKFHWVKCECQRTLYIWKKNNVFDRNHLTNENTHLTKRFVRRVQQCIFLAKFILYIHCRNYNVCSESTERLPTIKKKQLRIFITWLDINHKSLWVFKSQKESKYGRTLRSMSP